MKQTVDIPVPCQGLRPGQVSTAFSLPEPEVEFLALVPSVIHSPVPVVEPSSPAPAVFLSPEPVAECIAPAPAVFPVAQRHGEIGFLQGQRTTALRGGRDARHHGFHPSQSSKAPLGSSVARPQGFRPGKSSQRSAAQNVDIPVPGSTARGRAAVSRRRVDDDGLEVRLFAEYDEPSAIGYARLSTRQMDRLDRSRTRSARGAVSCSASWLVWTRWSLSRLSSSPLWYVLGMYMAAGFMQFALCSLLLSSGP